MVQILLNTVSSSMVSTEESKPLALTYCSIEIIKEIFQLLVKAYILLVGEFMMSAILMSGNVRT